LKKWTSFFFKITDIQKYEYNIAVLKCDSWCHRRHHTKSSLNMPSLMYFAWSGPLIGYLFPLYAILGVWFFSASLVCSTFFPWIYWYFQHQLRKPDLEVYRSVWRHILKFYSDCFEMWLLMSPKTSYEILAKHAIVDVLCMKWTSHRISFSRMRDCDEKCTLAKQINESTSTMACLARISYDVFGDIKSHISKQRCYIHMDGYH
jgi:hypothetical protein